MGKVIVATSGKGGVGKTPPTESDHVIGLLENNGVRDCSLIVNKWDRTLIERKK